MRLRPHALAALVTVLVPVLVALLSAGCVGTAVPQPPGLDPIDPSQVSSHTMIDSPTVEGGPGAATPLAGAEVWIWNLERSTGPGRGPIATDGSFTISFDHLAGDQLRLQVRTADDRSPPIDVLAPDGPVTPIEHPACLVAPVELDLGDARAADLSLENDGCPGAIELDAVDLRVGEAALTISGTTRASIPDGSRVDVHLSASGNGAVEDILFLHVTIDGVPDRLAVSVSVPAR
ncbi:MAG: hypothetical protein AB7S26_39960 [Sandaracinaceae bacterium]